MNYNEVFAKQYDGLVDRIRLGLRLRIMCIATLVVIAASSACLGPLVVTVAASVATGWCCYSCRRLSVLLPKVELAAKESRGLTV